jgi:hypothetical protein
MAELGGTSEGGSAAPSGDGTNNAERFRHHFEQLRC